MEKVRHLEVRTLLLQDQVDRGLIQVAKTAGQTNPADMCTKNLDGQKLTSGNGAPLPLCFKGARHVLAPQLHVKYKHDMDEQHLVWRSITTLLGNYDLYTTIGWKANAAGVAEILLKLEPMLVVIVPWVVSNYSPTCREENLNNGET